MGYVYYQPVESKPIEKHSPIGRVTSWFVQNFQSAWISTAAKTILNANPVIQLAVAVIASIVLGAICDLSFGTFTSIGTEVSGTTSGNVGSTDTQPFFAGIFAASIVIGAAGGGLGGFLIGFLAAWLVSNLVGTIVSFGSMDTAQKATCMVVGWLLVGLLSWFISKRVYALVLKFIDNKRSRAIAVNSTYLFLIVGLVTAAFFEVFYPNSVRNHIYEFTIIAAELWPIGAIVVLWAPMPFLLHIALDDLHYFPKIWPWIRLLAYICVSMLSTYGVFSVGSDQLYPYRVILLNTLIWVPFIVCYYFAVDNWADNKWYATASLIYASIAMWVSLKTI